MQYYQDDSGETSGKSHWRGDVRIERNLFSTGVAQSDELLGLYVRIRYRVNYKVSFRDAFKVLPGQLAFNWRSLPALLYLDEDYRPAINTLKRRLRILERLGAIKIDTHDSHRFSILTVRSVSNFDTVPVSNFDTVSDTVSDTVPDTVSDTVPLKKPTNSLVKPPSNKGDKGNKGKKGERETLTHAEIETVFQTEEFANLPESDRQRLTQEIQDAWITNQVDRDTWIAKLRQWTRSTLARNRVASTTSTSTSSTVPTNRPDLDAEVKPFFESRPSRKYVCESATSFYVYWNDRQWQRNGEAIDWRAEAMREHVPEPSEPGRGKVKPPHDDRVLSAPVEQRLRAINRAPEIVVRPIPSDAVLDKDEVRAAILKAGEAQTNTFGGREDG